LIDTVISSTKINCCC